MKTISPGLDAHLKQEVTTICTCWLVVRTDGQTFGFTDFDQDLVLGGITYESETGYNRTAITGDESFSVDNLDVTGFLESDRISENDLRNGLFDNAKVFIFACNWADVSQGPIKLRRGWFGEVILNRNGSFETEVRGLHQALAINFMETYQPDCRADFCDQRCKLNYADFIRTGVSMHILSRSQFYVNTAPYTPFVDSVGAHRYWQFRNPDGAGQYWSMAEIKFFDQSNASIAGGTLSVSSLYSGFSPPSNMRDGNSATDCAINPGVDQWVEVDFGLGNAKDLSGFSYQATANPTFSDTQSAHRVDAYYSDDGVAWTWVASWSDTRTIAASEVRKFSKFHEAPAVPVPPSVPAAGAGTYIGGTIKFTSGPNTGKIIEIVDWDQTTGLVTVFEDFPYEVSGGDALEIVQGCDKIFATCKLYGNQENFRGEPHVPGQDEFLKYPDAHD